MSKNSVHALVPAARRSTGIINLVGGQARCWPTQPCRGVRPHPRPQRRPSHGKRLTRRRRRRPSIARQYGWTRRGAVPFAAARLGRECSSAGEARLQPCGQWLALKGAWRRRRDMVQRRPSGVARTSADVSRRRQRANRSFSKTSLPRCVSRATSECAQAAVGVDEWEGGCLQVRRRE